VGGSAVQREGGGRDRWMAAEREMRSIMALCQGESTGAWEYI